MILAILASLILWPAYVAVFLVLAVLGYAVMFPLALCHLWVWNFSRVYHHGGTPLHPADVGRTGRHITRWCGGWLTWVWGNEEDGVTGPVWWEQRTKAEHGYVERAWSAYRWSAHRNPVNNLRFIPWVNPVIEPARIRFSQRALGYSDWTFTWQGPYAGLLGFIMVRRRTFRFWLGWKLKPDDRRGVPDTDMRKPRCGFAIQFKRVGS
jgi:hypothetical protein